MSEPELMQMVRTCREFQKYTGNDEIIIYNINSGYAPKFHIHPNLLASNFFERRQQFYDKLKEVVVNIEDDDELFEYCEDEEVSFMLHHFGIQTVIQKIERYKKELEEKQLKADLALQTEMNKDKNSKNKSDSSDNKREERLRIRERKTFIQKIKKRPLEYMLWCFIRLKNSEKVTIHSLKVIKNKAISMLNLGLMTQAHSTRIFKMIKDSSSSQLHKKLKCIKQMDKDNYFKFVDRKQMILMCKDLRSWTNNGIKGLSIVAEDYRHKAMELLSNNFFNYNNCKLCHFPHIYNSKNYENFGSELLMEKCVSSRTISNKHHYAKTIGVIKICIANDLIKRVKELNILGISCAACQEIFIALKMFKCSYKLSNGYIEDECFTEEKVLKLIEEVEEKWWNKKCNYCGMRADKNGYKKHRACTGCMKLAYCSRECQKLDWNEEHRQQCDKSWNSLYGALRMCLFDRL
eukprot:207315_1